MSSEIWNISTYPLLSDLAQLVLYSQGCYGFGYFFVFTRLLWRILLVLITEQTLFFFTCVISVTFVTVNNRSRFRLLEQQLLHLFIRIIALLCPLILATIFPSNDFFTLHGTGTGNSRGSGTGAMFSELCHYHRAV